jgi:DNA-binding beta-propeller fold protein YncE
MRILILMLLTSCTLLPSAAWSQSPPAFCTMWGSYGAEQGQFQYPEGVAIDASGNIYVADCYSNRIEKFCYGPTAVENTTWGRVKSMFR